MNSTKPTVICAWCERLLSEGTRDVTHGICPGCARDILRTAEARWSAAEPPEEDVRPPQACR